MKNHNIFTLLTLVALLAPISIQADAKLASEIVYGLSDNQVVNEFQELSDEYADLPRKIEAIIINLKTYKAIAENANDLSRTLKAKSDGPTNKNGRDVANEAETNTTKLRNGLNKLETIRQQADRTIDNLNEFIKTAAPSMNTKIAKWHNAALKSDKMVKKPKANPEISDKKPKTEKKAKHAKKEKVKKETTKKVKQQKNKAGKYSKDIAQDIE